ncbi:MAG TPA: glycoside hydrolase family 15 protein [Streptosporangiaceae bacterium]|nr:glycoside hydrolase family 15 protein [Streptosporangiaceae bacterium]
MIRRKKTSAGPASSAGQGFPPHALRDYALLADGERGAIIGPRGEIAWLCAPGWHSGSVFSALIGGAGVYAICPTERFVWGGFYEPRSLIWRSRWVTDTGSLTECREALAFPGDRRRLTLLRRVVAESGPASVHVLLEPRGEYDQLPLCDLQSPANRTWTGRVGPLYLRWSGAVTGARCVESSGSIRLELDLRLAAGQTRDLALEISDQPLIDAPPDPGETWRATEACWHDAVPEFANLTAGRDARHAYAVMRGLTSSANGMVAAATTSLPERAEAGRNYDYRYAWIRDQCYAGSAVAAAGEDELLDQAVRFVTARLHADGPALKPAYTADGGVVPDQSRLALPGYPGGFDLTGNWVNKQFQLDAFGEALLLFADAARLDHIDSEAITAAQIAADAIAERWEEPDAGIWEIDNQPWTHSRLICAAGLRAAAATCAPARLAPEWASLADRIVADTAEHAVHPSGRWQRSASDGGLDGALLLAAVRGAVPAYDPRTTATLDAYLRELVEAGYAYRFRHDDRPLGEAEGAFLLCSFILSLALLQQGNQLEAARFFERTRAACGPPGLFTEEFDVAQRQMRGNLPQAFVHALLLESAARLSEIPGLLTG